MTTQEHAFAAYYASMTDDELLRTAANRISFVDVAQRLLIAELARRRLEMPAATHESIQAKRRQASAFAKLTSKLHHIHIG